MTKACTAEASRFEFTEVPWLKPYLCQAKTKYIYIYIYTENITTLKCLHWIQRGQWLWSPAAHQPRAWGSSSSPSSTSSPVAVVSTDSPHQFQSSKENHYHQKDFLNAQTDKGSQGAVKDTMLQRCCLECRRWVFTYTTSIQILADQPNFQKFIHGAAKC